MTDKKINETELYIEFCRGNRESFNILTQTLSKKFYRFFYHLGAREWECEDLCQDFFIKLYTSQDHFDLSCDFLPWAYTIAKNMYYRYYSQNKKKNHSQLSENISNTIQGNFEYLDLKSALGKLTEEQRLLFELKHIQKLKFSEISNIMKIPEGTAKSRMFKIIQELSKFMREKL